MNKKIPILFSFRRCPYAMRARIAIRLCDLECEIREINLKLKNKEFLKISPKGTVPVLVLPDDKIIEESIDIVHWAIKTNDPYNLKLDNPIKYNEDIKLIRIFDGEFKYHLDRYKYDTRFKDAKREEHKYKARDLLVNLNDRLEEKKWLNGDNVSLSDISILPFIRQYRIADIKWFDEQLELPNINRWLDNFLNSKTLNNVMKKYKIWETTDPKIFL